MGFWLVVKLLIPLMMIVFGGLFAVSAPKRINGIFGYRTSASMKTKESWKFAHTYCGKLWLIIGCIILSITVGVAFLVEGKNTITIALAGIALGGVQLVSLVLPIVATEIALRKHFDENGNRID